MVNFRKPLWLAVKYKSGASMFSYIKSIHHMKETIVGESFFLPGKENYYDQEAGYAYLKELAEEFTSLEIYTNRIFRLLFRLEGVVVVAQVGEPCPVYKNRVSAIFETCCAFIVVSDGHIFNPLVTRKDEVLEVQNFRDQAPFLIAS